MCDMVDLYIQFVKCWENNYNVSRYFTYIFVIRHCLKVGNNISLIFIDPSEKVLRYRCNNLKILNINFAVLFLIEIFAISPFDLSLLNFR